MNNPQHSFQQFQTLEEFEQAARQCLPQKVCDYYTCGAGEERTLLKNRAAFQKYEFWPRILADVSSPDASTTLLGTKIPFPILVAPMGYHQLVHPEGELASAQGAAMVGALFILSILSTTSLEDVAKQSSAPKWFQVYITPRSRSDP